jgi:hypothetical protein
MHHPVLVVHSKMRSVSKSLIPTGVTQQRNRADRRCSVSCWCLWLQARRRRARRGRDVGPGGVPPRATHHPCAALRRGPTLALDTGLVRHACHRGVPNDELLALDSSPAMAATWVACRMLPFTGTNSSTPDLISTIVVGDEVPTVLPSALPVLLPAIQSRPPLPDPPSLLAPPPTLPPPPPW